MQYSSFFVIVVLVGIILKIGTFLLKMILGYTRFGKLFTTRPHPIMIHLHQEVKELKRTTLQIAKDWAELNLLIHGVRDQQSHFVLDLENDLNSMREALGRCLASRLHEQRLHSELRSEVLGRTVGAMVKEMAEMREAMKQKVKALAARKSAAVSVEDWTQTEGRRKREAKGPNDPETIKNVITAIRHALMEFMLDAQKKLSQEREEMMENVRVVFTQLVDDRDDIKATIAGAFSSTSQQTLRCFEQLGLFGRDAVGCIVSMGERSDQKTVARFQDLGSKVRDVLRSVRVIDINVTSVKDTLDNIDSQFDDIYRKLDTGQQASSQQCSELADRMASATRDFEDKSLELEAKHRQVSEMVSRATDAVQRVGGGGQTEKAELQAMVDMCGKRVQVVTAVLEQFASRVERPMQQVVCQMKFLTDVIGSRLNESSGAEAHLANIQSGAGEFHHQGGSILGALMEEPFQTMDQKGSIGEENSSTSDVTLFSTHSKLMQD